MRQVIFLLFSSYKVLVKNHVCGLNYLDVVIRKGMISLDRLGSTFPITVGVEAAGTVEKLGDKVDGFAVGERVTYAFVGSGELGPVSKLEVDAVSEWMQSSFFIIISDGIGDLFFQVLA